MSDLDAENLKKEQRKQERSPPTVNMTEDHQSRILSDKSEIQQNSTKKKTIKYFVIGGAVLLAVILIIVLSVTLTKEDTAPYHPDIPNPPGPAPGPPVPPPIIVVSPFAYQEVNNFSIDSQPTTQDWVQTTIVKFTTTQETMDLQSEQEQPVGDIRDGKTYQPVNPKNIPMGENNKQCAKAQLNFALIDNYQAQLIITNPENPDEYNVPEAAFKRPIKSFEARFSQVGFVQSSPDEPYYFNFTDIYSGETLISTYKRKLVFTSKFTEIGFVLPTKKIFGLGQHSSQFQLQNGTYTLWSRGRQGGLPTDTAEGGQNGPHVHPFILCQTKHNDFFGIFFAGSAQQTFEVVYYPGFDDIVLNYISLGGQVEIYFMMRGTAQEIISRYHALIGYSMVPPYYALGMFQGSNIYHVQSQIEDVITGYKNTNMALEGIILEDYNAGLNYVFTVDGPNFPTIADFVQQLHDNNQYILLGISSGISSATPEYQYYTDLFASQCYVVSSQTGKALVGFQSNTVIYPDYQCDDISGFFQNSLQDLDNLINFDGLLLNDNYYFSWSSGEYVYKPPVETIMQRLLQEEVQYTEESSGDWSGSYQINEDQSKISTYDLPFVPGYYWSGNLDNSTISLNATHSGNIAEYDVHNINGHMNLKKVFKVINESTSWSQKTKRPLIFSDSTWAGSGAIGAVSLSSMKRDWSSLRSIISQAMSFSMYGVQNVASEVCGSIGAMDEELCGRWAQVSAFLPMIRNYYNATYVQWKDASTLEEVRTAPSEFYLLESFDAQMMASSALNQRLPYTRYLYSQMYKVYRYGGSLIYPLFFDYADDFRCFEDVESTYMFGDAIKVSPVLEQGVTEDYEVYFPEGKWHDLNNKTQKLISRGEFFQLPQSYAATNVHLKAGKIIPFQLNTGLFKTTSSFLTDLKVSFIIYRDDSQYAEGYSLVDDGISSGTWDNIQYSFWKLRYASKSINFWVDQGDYTYTPPADMTIDQLDSIQILDAEDLMGTNFACFMGKDVSPTNMSYEYNPYDFTLTIKPMDGAVLRFKDIGFIKFGNSFNEPNFCNPETAFVYEVTYISLDSNDTFIEMTLQSMQGTRNLKPLIFTVILMDDFGTINVNITTEEDFNESGVRKFKVPYVTDFNQFKTGGTNKISDYFTFVASPFSYKIVSPDDIDTVYYQSDPFKLYFDDYMVMDSGIFSLNPLTNFPLMGMGERAGSLFYTNEQGGIHSRYTFDQANPIDDGLPPGRNMYGYQPFYIYQSISEKWVGVFDLSTYATDYILDFNNGVNTQITKIVIGGSIQKFFFFGDKPDDVIKKYSILVGTQTMPPLWSFGWQQCRFGWKTDVEWQDVVDSYKEFDLPLDTMWADIDYMDDYKIFTVSQSRYSKLADQVNVIRANNMTFVPIMDVGVAVRPNENYYAFDEGMSQDIFIKISDGSHPLTAGVWPGHAYFPDFWHEDINNYWHQAFDNLTTNFGLVFDGIWIDMNEATNFCNGYCVPGERPTDSLRNKPYYVPGWRDLEDKALGVDGLHQNGWHEYDLHSTYSLMQVKSTSEYLISKNLRPYVLSRSNFPGLSEYGYHWMGDNWSTLEYMKLSVDGMYHYQLFGLPFSGSDICGFDGDAIPTLCTRWHQLGSLYPFARNHNQNASISQEPYVFDIAYPADPTITYTDIIRSALRTRYSYIKYYYSHFFDLQTSGASFFKPLFFEFPSDPQAYYEIQKNILLGDALKASIEVTTLDEGASDFYFPKAMWCQLHPYIAEDGCIDSQGENVTLRSHLTDYNIHLREGYLIPFTNATLYNVHTTKDLVSLDTDLIILPLAANAMLETETTASVSAAAIGYLYLDDGISFAEQSSRFDFIFTLGTVKNTATLTIKQVKNGYDRTDNSEENLGQLIILQAARCQLDGVVKITANPSGTGGPINLSGTYDASLDTLTIDVIDYFSGNHLSVYDIDTITFQ